MKLVVQLVTLILLVNVSLLHSARPFTIDDAGTVTTTFYELEIGSEFWDEQLLFNLGFKHGLTDLMDIGIGFDYTVQPEDIDGFSPYELGFKFVLLPEHIAVSITGNPGEVSYNLTGIVTYYFRQFEVDINLGYAATGIQGLTGDFVYGTAFIIDLNPISIGAEVSGLGGEINDWLFGGRYYLLEGLAIDCGISGSFETESDNIALVGLHYEF